RAHGAAGGGGDGEDADGGVALGREHPFGDLGRVVHRNGGGHGADAGEAAGRGGRSAGGDGFLVALAGLAQMDVNVDEAGGDDEAVGVDDFGVLVFGFAGGFDGGDLAVFQQ